jgi:XisH protein
MPARDFYHDTVKNVLIKDGWTITHDPFPLRYGIRRLYADLGAEKLFAAAKASRKIVVEVKASAVHQKSQTSRKPSARMACTATFWLIPILAGSCI